MVLKGRMMLMLLLLSSWCGIELVEGGDQRSDRMSLQYYMSGDIHVVGSDFV